MSEYILEMRNITKEFPGVKALNNVSFKVKKGEIKALVGENGAGKSTLMKVLSGVYGFGTYTGDIVLNGEVSKFDDIKDSEKAGIAIIHQELALIPLLSIAEKPKMVFLNHGDPDSCEAFRDKIREMGYNAFAPYSGTSFDLIRGEFDLVTEGVAVERAKEVSSPKENPVFTALVKAGERLTAAILSLKGSPNKELRVFERQVTKLAERLENYRNS